MSLPFGSVTGPTLSRRDFLAGGGFAACGLAGGVALDAFGVETRSVELTRHSVPVPGLAPELDGLRVAQVSDVHLYHGLHPAARRTMALLLEERPEIVVITGDACENSGVLGDLASFVRRVRGSLATIAILGNWESYGEISRGVAERVYGQAGATLLVNQALTLRRGGAELTMLGLDDPLTGHPDLAAALSESGAGPAILLVHAPGCVDDLVGSGLPAPALALAGHTHGGQIRIPFLPPVTPPASGRFVAGWYRDTFAPLYVSRGIGTADIRARFRCPPELPVFTLQRA